jgi:ABC transport system ATP-binding/permease protein
MLDHKTSHRKRIGDFIMKSVLTIHMPTGDSRQVELTRDSYDLGRLPENDIVIPAAVVSRKHARLEWHADSWWYTDLDSQNGTHLNGERIRNITLQDGMTLQLGQSRERAVTLSFHIAAEKPSTPLPFVVETIMETQSPTTGYIHLRPSAPSKTGTQFIGRGKEADISLPAPVVSRRHASLQPGTPEWSLTDLGSKNGTFLNGRRITRPEQLKPGDVIQVGPFRLVYEGQGKVNRFAASRGLRLDGKGLSWIVGKGAKRKTILDDVNISCYPQEFIALVGGSGAGKSTLMKALSGLLPMKGQVLVEGDNLYTHYDAYRTMIGYVPQDDILHPDLTVQEALEYSARLRLPPDSAEEEIQSRIERALEQVELIAQRKQIISSLSGGQRKRASIAVELLADPPLFFLDEPTSGLDPGLEKKVMLILRKLAESGKTIILVTHATANITECHQVAFMSQGHLVYYGPPRQACDFFNVGKDDFAEIYSQISDADPKQAKQKAESWERRFRQSAFFTKVTERFQALTGSGRGTNGQRPSGRKFSLNASVYQFLLLTKRYFSLIFRDRTLLIILLAVMPLLALLILGIAESNWLTGDSLATISRQLIDEMASGKQTASYYAAGGGQKLLFIMALTAVMLGLFSSAYEIVKERTIYERERMVFMQLIPYLASKVFPLAAFAAVQCFLFLLVIGVKVDFPLTGTFLPFFIEAYVTLFLAVLTAISLGLFVSSIAPNPNTVTYIILGVLFLQITFAGVIFELPGTAKSLSSVTLTRWTMQALGASSNLEHLDTLSRTRFQPNPITQDVEMDVEKPDPNWIPGQEMVMVHEKVTKSVTIDHPDPLEVHTPYGFTLNYESSLLNLIENWATLLGLSLALSAGALVALKRRDVV